MDLTWLTKCWVVRLPQLVLFWESNPNLPEREKEREQDRDTERERTQNSTQNFITQGLRF